MCTEGQICRQSVIDILVLHIVYSIAYWYSSDSGQNLNYKKSKQTFPNRSYLVMKYKPAIYFEALQTQITASTLIPQLCMAWY